MEMKKWSSTGVPSCSILAKFYQTRLRSDCGAVRVCLYSCCSFCGVYVVGFPGLHKTTKKSAAEFWYMTFEAQTFFGRNIYDFALLHLEYVAMCTAAVLHI